LWSLWQYSAIDPQENSALSKIPMVQGTPEPHLRSKKPRIVVGKPE